MGYVFDDYALQYMLEQFPRSIVPHVWEVFSNNCRDGVVVSERETQKKLIDEVEEDATIEWCKEYSFLFLPIGERESVFLSNLMNAKEFHFLDISDRAKRRLPEGLPFLLSIAKQQDRCFVYRKNTNKDIIDRVIAVCKKYLIAYEEVEEYLLACK